MSNPTIDCCRRLLSCPGEAPVLDDCQEQQIQRLRGASGATEICCDEGKKLKFRSTPDCQMKLARLNQDNFDLRLYCYNLKDKIRRVEQSSNCEYRPAAGLGEDIAQLREGYERKSALLVEGARALKQLNSELEAIKDEKQQVCSALSQQSFQVQTLMRENSELCSASCHLEHRCQLIQEQYGTSECRRIELETLLHRSQCDVTVMKSQLREFWAQLEQLTADRVQLDLEIERLRDIESRSGQQREALENVKKLNERLEESQAEMQKLREENRSLTEQLEAIPRLKRDIELFEAEDKALRAELKAQQDSLREFEAQVAKKKSEADEAQKQLNALRDAASKKLGHLTNDVNANLSISDLQDLLMLLVKSLKQIQAAMKDIGDSVDIDAKTKRHAIVGLMQEVVVIFTSISTITKKKIAEDPNSPDAPIFLKLTAALDMNMASMNSMIAAESKK